MEKKYIEIVNKNKKKLENKKNKSKLIGIAKFIMIILLLIQLTKINEIIILISFIITLIVTITFFIIHVKYENQINEIEILIQITKKYKDRINGEWIHFKDIGEEYLENTHLYSGDLDILGNKSLFQFLNITNTIHGRLKFKNDLTKVTYTENEIRKRQSAISELSRNYEFTVKFESLGYKINGNKNVLNLIEEGKNSTEIIENQILKIIIKYIPLITVVSILVGYVLNNWLISVTLIFIQILLFLKNAANINKKLEIIKYLNYSLKDYTKLFELVKNQKYESLKLNKIQKELNNSVVAFQKLEKLENLISFRNNIITYTVLNILFLYDYHCIFKFEKWKKENGNDIEKWLKELGEFESLLCFSNLSNILDTVSMPEINIDKKIVAKQIGHPLLPNEKRKYNDYTNDNQIFIISGSNMSGKTTFLRTIGINLVLANTGAYTCAKSLNTSIFKLGTSMRIVDDLNSGISTFYAELKRIKMILDIANNEGNIFFLIDEIFRGTNSKDRLLGAKTVIKNLDQLSCCGLITTHDLELCRLENNERINNLSFQEYYENNQIYFDYLIKEGYSKTTNAKYLMKMVGIKME